MSLAKLEEHLKEIMLADGEKGFDSSERKVDVYYQGCLDGEQQAFQYILTLVEGYKAQTTLNDC